MTWFALFLACGANRFVAIRIAPGRKEFGRINQHRAPPESKILRFGWGIWIRSGNLCPKQKQ